MLNGAFIDVSVGTYSQNITEPFVQWRRVSTSWIFEKCEATQRLTDAAKMIRIVSCSCLHSCRRGSAWVLSRRSIHVNTDTNWPKSHQNHTRTTVEVYPVLIQARRK